MRSVALGFAGLFLALVAGCTTTPPAAPADLAITFQHRQPLILKVAAIEVVDQYQPALRAPYVEHLHRLTPASIIRRWTDERIETAGARGLVTLIVTEATVAEEELQVAEGLAGLFRDEPDLALVGILRASFSHVDVGPPATSHLVEIVAEARVEVLESATLNERDLAYFRVVEKLAGEFDQALTAEIKRSLAHLIVR